MRNFLCLSMCSISTLVFCQFPYEATVMTEYYVALENPTVLDIELGWDDPEVEIPVPFEVTIGTDEPLSSLLISGTGEMLISTTESGAMNILWPISLDVMDIGAVEAESASFIQYEVTGEAPNRVLKVEWKDVGLYEEISSSGTANWQLNFQVWLYENQPVIEYRFGPNTIDIEVPESVLLTSGLILNFDYDYYSGLFYMSSGLATEPVWSLSDDFYSWYYGGENLDQVPPDGTVYQFGPVSDVESLDPPTSGFSLFPNPANGEFWIQNHSPLSASLQLIDLAGRIVDQYVLQGYQRLSVPCSDWAPGWYSVQYFNANGAPHSQPFLVH